MYVRNFDDKINRIVELGAAFDGGEADRADFYLLGVQYNFFVLTVFR